MSDRGDILIAGGYGVVGRRIATQLAPRFRSRVVVAGRDAGRAEALCREIGHETRGRRIDVIDAGSIGPALNGVGTVVAASPTERCTAADVDRPWHGYTDIARGWRSGRAPTSAAEHVDRDDGAAAPVDRELPVLFTAHREDDRRRVQRELECTIIDERIAAVAFCDRGTLDGLAYWPGSVDELWTDIGSSVGEEVARYAAVIHLRTPHELGGYNHRTQLASRPPRKPMRSTSASPRHGAAIHGASSSRTRPTFSRSSRRSSARSSPRFLRAAAGTPSQS